MPIVLQIRHVRHPRVFQDMVRARDAVQAVSERVGSAQRIASELAGPRPASPLCLARISGGGLDVGAA